MRRLLGLVLVFVPVVVVAAGPGTGAGASAISASVPVVPVATARAALRGVSAGRLPAVLAARRGSAVAGGPVKAESYNWAGYADDNSKSNTYHRVSGAWTQPTATCTSEDRIAVFFVGIDGFSGPTAEQDGTVAQCFEGVAFYYTWWAMPPDNGFQIVGSTLAPGDKVTASVSRAGTQDTLKVTDATHPGNSFTTTQACAATTCPGSSAEWITGPATGVRGDFPLPDFKDWSLTAASVASGSKTGTISAFPDDQITMFDSSVTYPLAQPTRLGPGGKSFTVAWKNSY
jgi:peptidase A4-like protein